MFPPIRPELVEGAAIRCTPQRRRLIDLKSGEDIREPQVEVRISYIDVGFCRISSGRVIVFDPMLLADAQPYTQEVPTGRHAVQVLQVAYPDGDRRGTRIGAAVVRFSQETPEAWRIACRPDEEERQLGPGEVFGFGVDSASACFLDALSQAALVQLGESCCDELWDRMESSSSPAMVWSDPGLHHDVFVCAAGAGDGLYSSYFGYDVSGSVACLVVDFDLLDVQWPRGKGRWWQRLLTRA